MKQKILPLFFTLFLCIGAQAQINTGSTGSDGALDFSGITNSTNIVIDMHDHPNGVYQYTQVNIPKNVTVTFVPNANNSPVVWLVQNSCLINGTLNVRGQDGNGVQGGVGGPSGYSGGLGPNGSPPTGGQGPGGGNPGQRGNYDYANNFLIPLRGGSGGGGSGCGGGGGGGGAILIAASSLISINGLIDASGGSGNYQQYCGNAPSGSGGGIRLVSSQISGSGQLSADRIRFDTYDREFTGNVGGQSSQGFQPIIIPTAGQLPQLTVTSVGGVPVSTSPTGILSTPDAVLSAQQNNPIPVVVSCANLPLNSQITVSVKPANGSGVSAIGLNNTGTLSSSTATVSIAIPRGGGLIYATATTSN